MRHGRSGSGRGRGNSRGRGMGSGRGRGKKSVTSLSRKDTAHLRQFGESHPADGLGNFKNPTKKMKMTKDRRGHGNDEGKEQNRSSSEEESDESDEEESTPYHELLSIFTGHKNKAPVQIISESEEEIEEEDHEGGDGDITNTNEVDAGSDHDRHKRMDESFRDHAKSYRNSDEAYTNSKHEISSMDEEEVEDLTMDDEVVVEEAELDSENETDDSNILDSFDAHFQRELSPHLQTLLSGEKPLGNSLNVVWPTLEKVQYAGLKTVEENENDVRIDKKNGVLEYTQKLITHPPCSPPADPRNPTLESLYIKRQLHKTIPRANQKLFDGREGSDVLTNLQQELLLLATSYHDIYFPQRNCQNEDEIRIAYCIHIANHVLKTRTRILHHNAKITKKVEVPEEFRDQGFVRPKVLVLTPFKETALRIVKTLISLVLTEEKGNVQNKKRFVDEFGGETLFLPKTNPKPPDYMALFSGNVDDNFKIGLAITKKNIKLYTGFYASDVIVASPLGLRMIVGAEGEKDRDYDFLSSIEVLVMDQADVFLMQNWDHVLHLVRHLHLQPVTTHGTDFSRIRPWALENLTKFYCQTLLFSSLICPEHLAFFTRNARNYAGLAKVINPILTSHMSTITIQLPQIFQQFDCDSIGDSSDARFEHFVTKVLPNFKGKLMSHTLVFVSSYFDFVRVRNYLRKEEQSFVQICEYTKDKKIARARDLFFHGKNKLLLYTERAHFFRRFRLKGIGHIIFYQLPQNPHFYSELCNFMQEGYQNRRVRQRKNVSVNVIYSKYDATRLASLVGTERANYMLASEKPTHAFVTEAL